MSDKVSIIVPVYNAEKYLDECIQSLLRQSHENIEVILVNDGSKDTSWDICQRYAEKDARVVAVTQENQGVSAARNHGLDKASGDFIMFCDSDDCVSRHWCQRMLEEYQPDQLLMCEFQEWSDADAVNLLQMERSVVRNGMEIINKADFLLYRERGIGLPTTKIFSRQVVASNNIRFPRELSLGEDLAFVIEYIKVISGNISFLKEKLYFYRWARSDSLSHKAPSLKQCEIFFEMLTNGMMELNVQSEVSWRKRDDIVMSDFEKSLIAVAQSTQLSRRQRYNVIRGAMNSAAYCTCCRKGRPTSNCIYGWILKHRLSGALFLFISIRFKNRWG